MIFLQLNKNVVHIVLYNTALYSCYDMFYILVLKNALWNANKLYSIQTINYYYYYYYYADRHIYFISFHLFASVLSHLVTMDLSKFIRVEYNLIFNKHTLGTTINI